MEYDRKIGNTYLNRSIRAPTAAAETSERRVKSETLTQRSLGASLSTVDGLPDINYFNTAHREKPEVHEFFQLPFLFGNLPTSYHGQRRRKGHRRIPWTRFGRRFFITHPLFRRFQGFKVGKYSRFQLGLYNNLGDANKTSTRTNAREDDLKINIGVYGDTRSLNSAGNTSKKRGPWEKWRRCRTFNRKYRSDEWRWCYTLQYRKGHSSASAIEIYHPTQRALRRNISPRAVGGP